MTGARAPVFLFGLLPNHSRMGALPNGIRQGVSSQVIEFITYLLPNSQLPNGYSGVKKTNKINNFRLPNDPPP